MQELTFDNFAKLHEKLDQINKDKNVIDYVDSRVFTDYLVLGKGVFTEQDIKGYIDDFYKIKDFTDPDFSPQKKIETREDQKSS